jgi:hypothetical protein
MIIQIIFALSLLVQPAKANEPLDLSSLNKVLMANRSHYCSITDEQKSDHLLKKLRINEDDRAHSFAVKLYDPEHAYVSTYLIDVQTVPGKPLRDRVSMTKTTIEGVFITGRIYQNYPTLAAYVNTVLRCQTNIQASESDSKELTNKPSWLSGAQSKFYNLIGR